MNRRDLRRLARIRLKEARILLNANCFDGAYYLSGYAVECALKACIAKTTKRSEFPDLEKVKGSYTHKFTELVKLARLQATLEAEQARDAAFRSNWRSVSNWTEQSRYAEQAEHEARTLYKAISDREHGVMRWLKRHW